MIIKLSFCLFSFVKRTKFDQLVIKLIDEIKVLINPNRGLNIIEVKTSFQV